MTYLGASLVFARRMREPLLPACLDGRVVTGETPKAELVTRGEIDAAA